MLFKIKRSSLKVADYILIVIDRVIEDKTICFSKDTSVKAQAELSVLKMIASENEQDEDTDNSRFYTWIAILFAISLILVVMFVFTLWRSKKVKIKLEKMRHEWLETFHSGQEELIDWNEDIVLQAKLLPYKAEFEFSMEDLQIEDELGRGEFGVVHRAIAKGLGKDGSDLEVAVKKSKNLKLSEIRTFAEELKIMMFLQKIDKESHVNIINLLGTITVDIKKGEIYAILELCQHGSLIEFIIDNRVRFKNDFALEDTNIDEVYQDVSHSEYVTFNDTSSCNPISSENSQYVYVSILIRQNTNYF